MAKNQQAAEVLAKAREAGVRFVRFLAVGNDGIIRGKSVHVDFLEERLEAGAGLAVAVQSFTMLDTLVEEGSFGPVGEVRLLPDLGTFRTLPYAPKSARVLCDLVHPDGRPWGVCARAFLKRMIARLADNGWALRAAFENEFYLTVEGEDAFLPYDSSGYMSSIGMDSAEKVVQDMAEALEKQGVRPESYAPEMGPGQQEIAMRHRDALGAADEQVVFRETVRAVAEGHGLRASFAPKPFPEEAGSGCHIHLSIWDAKMERNLFHEADARHQLSTLARHFVGGVLRHVPALCAITAPTVNSYRRLRPRSWSSAFACWGPDNREATLRIASTVRGAEMASLNVEYKPADPAQNPYLALGAVIAAGLDGIEKERDPGREALEDPATMDEGEREKNGWARLPESLGQAIHALESDTLLKEALGEALHREYLTVKRAEDEAFRGKDTDFEITQHFYKF